MMHFQIRMKEKCLLLSMVLYLFIISLVLLIISPVSGYTLYQSYSISNTTATDYNWQHSSGVSYLFSNMTTLRLADITHIEWDGPLKRTAAGGTSSGTLSNIPIYYVVDSVICAFVDVAWEVPDTVGGYEDKHWEIDILSWANTSHGSCKLAPSNYKIGYPSDTDPAYTAIKTYDGNSGVNSTALMVMGGSSGYFKGQYSLYTGSAVPDVPEITDFTVEKSCYNPNESVILHANVTGTVDTWNWKVYDLNGTVISETSDPVDTVTDPLLVVGLLAAKVTVTNTGGSDDDYRTQFINVSQPGTCNFTPYDPFPTVTVSPTIQVYPTLTLPVITDTNMTGINTEIDELWIIGNMSEGYREMVDYYGEGVNTTFTGLVGIIVSPFTFIANAVSTGSTLFSTSISSLMSYTTIPLAIVGITLGFYPWQIITLITAGIAVDAIFVLVFGVR